MGEEAPTVLSPRYCPWLAALLILTAGLLHLAYLTVECPLDLAPDEAHYWDWSRHLDWSYYSKGPLVAWLIRASCELLGPLSERLTGSVALAVRAPAVLCGSLLVTSLYVLCVQAFARPRLALALVAVALTMPLIAVGSTLMTIDSPYTCCWGWALVFGHRAVRGGSPRNWDVCGVLIGLGILAKYTMILFPACLGLYLLIHREHRRQLFSMNFARLLLLAALLCIPILIWNAQHDWVTFHHVRQLAGLSVAGEPSIREQVGIRWLGPLHYVGGQALLLMGYWFLTWLVVMIVWHPWRERDPAVRYLWWLSAPVFLLFFAFSFKTGGGELNWPVTAYLSGGVLVAAWLAQECASPRRWWRRLTHGCLTLTLLIGLGLTLLVHRSDVLYSLAGHVGLVPTTRHPYPMRRVDPTCRLRGWRFLGTHVDAIRDRLRQSGNDPVLAATNWSIPGELGVYCAGQPQVYSVGLVQGDRHSQYDLWTNPVDDPDRFLGRTFVIVGPTAPAVTEAFARVEPVVQITYVEKGQAVAGWRIQVCHGFKGFTKLPTRAAH